MLNEPMTEPKILFSQYVIQQIHKGEYKNYFTLMCAGWAGWASPSYGTDDSEKDDWYLSFSGLFFSTPYLYRGDVLIKLDRGEKKRLREARKVLIANDKRKEAREKADRERERARLRWWP